MAAKFSTASEVRAWGRVQNANGAEFTGLGEGARGRLAPALVEAFNAAHPRAKYQTGATRPKTVEVTVETQDKRGRKRSRKVVLDQSEARTVAAQAGAKVGARGRLSGEALTAAALAKIGR
jgi:hypothetical protein